MAQNVATAMARITSQTQPLGITGPGRRRGVPGVGGDGREDGMEVPQTLWSQARHPRAAATPLEYQMPRNVTMAVSSWCRRPFDSPSRDAHSIPVTSAEAAARP